MGTEGVLRALVTGGAGFLGSRIVRRLLDRGVEVTVLSRAASRVVEPQPGLRAMDGDLRDDAALAEAVRGQDAVFHVAAKAGVWGSRHDYFSVNFEGTRAVLRACREHGVPRLIYTSTPSVVFAPGGVENGDESLPYPAQFLTHYAASKAMAEQAVLKANGEELRTVALRPHLIWGHGDPHLLPRVLARARAGRLKQVGDGTNRVDITHVHDAAQAHLDALDQLDQAAGKAYFIHSETVTLWPWINSVLARAGVAPVTARVGAQTAYRLGALLESIWRALMLPGEPPMTRFVAENLSCPHWFSIGAARRDLGYVPQWTGDRALQEYFEAPQPVMEMHHG